jgi:DNA-binding Lrp family transcriptional regulator
MKSYILINTKPAQKEEIKKELLQFEFTVEEINESFKNSNILVKVCVNNRNALKCFIAEQLKRIRGIKKIRIIT